MPAKVHGSAYKTLYYGLVFFLVLSVYWVFSHTSNSVPLSSSRRTVCSPSARAIKRVAIVGAGSAGASTAYYLGQFSDPCLGIAVTVYERSGHIGGRSTTVDVYDDTDQPVEVGASIFVNINRNLVSAATRFGLNTVEAGKARPGESPTSLGIWDGRGFKYVQSSVGYYWWDVAKLLWKYGLAPVKTRNLMRKTVGAFLRMYNEPVFPFRSLSQAVLDVDLTAVTSMQGNTYLVQNSISPPFSTDIIQASTRVNYAQNLDQIHGLETMVCMATDGAMAVEGGNWRIFQAMLEHSDALVLLNTSVTAVSKQANGTFLVLSEHTDGKVITMMQNLYEAVVIAAPLQFTKIELSPRPEHVPDEIDYVQLYVTLFASPHRLSPKFFGMSTNDAAPETILTTLPDNADSGSQAPEPAEFYSFSTLRKVLNPTTVPPRHEYLYKVFSPAPLKASLLANVLDFPTVGENLRQISSDDISWLYEKKWYSYPYLPPRMTFENLQLDQNLWYTSGIESFISTMETSSLMGMNVARLITDDWLELYQNKAAEEL